MNEKKSTTNVPSIGEGENKKYYCHGCNQYLPSGSFGKVTKNKHRGQLNEKCKACRSKEHESKKRQLTADDITWITNEQLKEIGYIVPPAIWEKEVGRTRLTTYPKADPSAMTSIISTVAKNAAKMGLGEDGFQDAVVRMAVNCSSGTTPINLEKEGIKELQRLKKQKQRKNEKYVEVTFEDIDNYVYPDYQTRTSESRSNEWSGLHDSSAEERQLIREQINAEVKKYNKINRED